MDTDEIKIALGGHPRVLPETEDTEVHPMFPDQLFPIQPPRNLSPDHLPVLGQFERSGIHASRVTILKNAVAPGRGPIWHGGRFRDECFVTWDGPEEFLRRKKHWQLSFESLLSKKHRVAEPTLWITDDWSCGYFHWICDALPRLLMASRVEALENLTLLLPAKSKRFPFIRQTLDAFPLKAIRVLGRLERARCSNLVLPSQLKTTGNYQPELMRELQETIWRHAGRRQPETPTRKIYLSRGDANRRRLVNESDLQAILERNGFESVVADSLSWIEQVRLFSETSHLVSIHGAGLTNMLFMPPGGRVLELRDNAGYTPNCYLTLATTCRHDYYCDLYRRADLTQSVHHGDVIADPQSLEIALAQMLSDAPAKGFQAA